MAKDLTVILEDRPGSLAKMGEALGKAGLLKRKGLDVKVLGTGELTKALTVVASQFTEGAKRKIEAAGGRCEEASA